MTEQQRLPELPGAVGITHLRVYDTSAPDGLRGGSPHVHLACTEAYIPVAGSGTVQTLSARGFAEVTLEPWKVVWFTPGVIHRLINLDGRLEILVVMQNAGLPEAGDFVLTFPPEVLADDQAYRQAASLAEEGRVYASDFEAAQQRRNRAVEGFLQLRKRFEHDGPAALEAYYTSARRIVGARLMQWRQVWEAGPLDTTMRTAAQLQALQHGDLSHLFEGGVYSLPAPEDARKLGMCGTLAVYSPEGVCL